MLVFFQRRFPSFLFGLLLNPFFKNPFFKNPFIKNPFIKNPFIKKLREVG